MCPIVYSDREKCSTQTRQATDEFTNCTDIYQLCYRGQAVLGFSCALFSALAVDGQFTISGRLRISCDRFFFPAESAATVISGKSTSHQITSPQSLIVQIIRHCMSAEDRQKMKLNERDKAEIRKTESLAICAACKTILEHDDDGFFSLSRTWEKGSTINSPCAFFFFFFSKGR